MKKQTFKTFKKISVFLLVAFVFTVLIFVVTRKKEAGDKEAILPAVVVQKPVRKQLVESIKISGYVEADATIPVVPFVSGTIMEYPVKVGDFVSKDTVIAKIDDEPFKQQMLQAQASYSAAKSTFERVQSLYKSGATTQQNYDTAKAQYDASKAQYELAVLQMNYTQVKAPVDGTVLIANQAVGGIGTQSSPLVVLADLSNQVIRLKVPEKYFDLFTMEKDNLRVMVIRPSEQGMYEDAQTSATIQNIAPYISPESKNFEVVCRLDSPGERFRPGMFVRVEVAYKTYENAPVVPIYAKKMDGSCYIYNEDSATVSFVTLPQIASDDNFFIVPEEYADSLFVVDGQNFVFDGQRVKLYDQAVMEY